METTLLKRLNYTHDVEGNGEPSHLCSQWDSYDLDIKFKKVKVKNGIEENDI